LKTKTKQARVDDIVAVIEAVSAEPWAQQILLAGHSEGTHVVTGVVRQGTPAGIAAAGLFASAGPTPFWGGYVSSGAGQREVFQRGFERMRMLQSATDDFMYEGLPARRWRTFWLDTTPLDDIRDSTVPLFIAAGTRDGTILAPDLFVMEAIRQQPNRTVRYVVVDGGDHAFETPDRRSHIRELFDDFLAWALDETRTTGTAVVK
jgi:dienelactone hydrolase